MFWKSILLAVIVASHYIPIAQASTLATNSSVLAEALILGDADIDDRLVERLNKQGLILATEPASHRLVLYKGNLLLACSKRVHLLLANAELDLAPNSMVYISDNGYGTCSILNLHDEHLKDVKVHVGEANVDLPPGRQLILTSSTDSRFDDVNLCCGVRFRDVAEFRPVPTIKAFCVQYSLPSALQVLPAVFKLAKSNTKEGRKMMKTAAAVYASSGYPNDFRLSMARR